MADTQKLRLGKRFQGSIFSKKENRDALMELLNCFLNQNISAKTRSSDGSTIISRGKSTLSPLGWSVLLDLTNTSASGGASGFPWMYPTHFELDPTLTYAAGYCAAISPQSLLVQSGIVDLVSGTNTVSRPGIWLATQNIPAQATVGGVVKYNVPQLPLPGSNTSAPSGSPLKGDFDSASVYWTPIWIMSTC